MSAVSQAWISRDRAEAVAHDVATELLGRDSGRFTLARSSSHHVYVGADVVVKLIGDDDHSRLDREVALLPHLPVGLTAELLGSGRRALGSSSVRYACYRRVPGDAPGIGLPGVAEPGALNWAAQALCRLDDLHRWTPTERAAQTLREPLDHGGFVTRDRLVADVGRIADEDHAGLVSRLIIDGLADIADHAPLAAAAVVPVHADCHWGNWLVDDLRVTALLDFEWARFGAPVDDWVFLARFSGSHQHAVLRLISDTAGTPLDELRSDCEVREAAYLTSDLLIALPRYDELPQDTLDLLADLEDLVVNRSWWRTAA